jgi:hypothetical protein
VRIRNFLIDALNASDKVLWSVLETRACLCAYRMEEGNTRSSGMMKTPNSGNKRKGTGRGIVGYEDR